jgi:1,4-dihydroxy-2-naphthoate octaprenyltransferase
VLARYHTGLVRWAPLLWGVADVVLIMLATYYAGEYWDQAEDALAGELGRSRFSGGSGVIQRGLLPRRTPLIASIVSLVLAVAVTLVLQFIYDTGPWTLALATVGMVGGFFYSTRPVRWVGRGWGELWIALCYGWLPVAVGYYLQTGTIHSIVHWVSLPIALTIFDVILLNEFPDYAADRAARKGNLLVRFGPVAGARLYAGVAVLAWATAGVSLWAGVPTEATWAYLPPLAASLLVTALMLAGRWRHRRTLEVLCGLNLLVNLGTTAAYIVTYWG